MIKQKRKSIILKRIKNKLKENKGASATIIGVS